MLNAPVAIGGTGGSGTRLVAQILSAARRFLGRRLNAFYDAPDLAEFDPQWGLPHLLDEAGPEMSTAFGAGRTPGPSRRCLARIATWWCDWRTYAASPKPRFGACSTSPATTDMPTWSATQRKYWPHRRCVGAGLPRSTQSANDAVAIR